MLYTQTPLGADILQYVDATRGPSGWTDTADPQLGALLWVALDPSEALLGVRSQPETVISGDPYASGAGVPAQVVSPVDQRLFFVATPALGPTLYTRSATGTWQSELLLPMSDNPMPVLSQGLDPSGKFFVTMDIRFWAAGMSDILVREP